MFNFHEFEKTIIAELTNENFIISDVQDAVDLLGNATFSGCSSVIVRESNLTADFFVLKTGLAGDILQKFSNYRIQLAIVGNFSKYKSKSLQDFIRECNKGNLVFFCDDIETALGRLLGK
jgi:hypothetical protein